MLIIGTLCKGNFQQTTLIIIILLRLRMSAYAYADAYALVEAKLEGFPFLLKKRSLNTFYNQCDRAIAQQEIINT